MVTLDVGELILWSVLCAILGIMLFVGVITVSAARIRKSRMPSRGKHG